MEDVNNSGCPLVEAKAIKKEEQSSESAFIHCGKTSEGVCALILEP